MLVKLASLTFLAVASWAAQAQQKTLYVDVSPTATPDFRPIRMKPGTDLVVRTDGNIEASCALETINGVSNVCNNVGAPAGPLPTIFSFPNLVVAQGASLPRLTWSTNAEVCRGISPPTLPGWVGPLVPNNTVGMTLNTLPPGVFDFTMRCYSAAGHVDAVAQVTVQAAPSPAVSCANYLDSLSPADRNQFNAYQADQRGMAKVESTFVERTGNMLGLSSGYIMPGLPGILGDNQYLALSFTMPAAGTSPNTGKFILNFTPPPGSLVEHAAIMAISPCPGDFRPRDTSAGAETYKKAVCRSTYSMASQIRGAVPGVDASRCLIPANTTMYLNIALRNMYTPPGSAIPPDVCPDGTPCGVGASLSN